MFSTVLIARRALRAVAGLLALAAPAGAIAQVHALPVLQNAFVGPGITVAGNVGGGGSAGTTYGAAGAWAPATARFQLSAGLGLHAPETGKRGAAYGLRAAVPITRLMGGSLGLAGFAGAGTWTTSETTVSSVPIGGAVGYRLSLGGRGVSVYGAPYYSFTRTTADGEESVSANRVRASAGLDVSLTSSIGVTVGFDGGSGGSLLGLGVSWAMGRR